MDPVPPWSLARIRRRTAATRRTECGAAAVPTETVADGTRLACVLGRGALRGRLGRCACSAGTVRTDGGFGHLARRILLYVGPPPRARTPRRALRLALLRGAGGGGCSAQRCIALVLRGRVRRITVGRAGRTGRRHRRGSRRRPGPPSRPLPTRSRPIGSSTLIARRTLATTRRTTTRRSRRPIRPTGHRVSRVQVAKCPRRTKPIGAITSKPIRRPKTVRPGPCRRTARGPIGPRPTRLGTSLSPTAIRASSIGARCTRLGTGLGPTAIWTSSIGARCTRLRTSLGPTGTWTTSIGTWGTRLGTGLGPTVARSRSIGGVRCEAVSAWTDSRAGSAGTLLRSGRTTWAATRRRTGTWLPWSSRRGTARAIATGAEWRLLCLLRRSWRLLAERSLLGVATFLIPLLLLPLQRLPLLCLTLLCLALLRSTFLGSSLLSSGTFLRRPLSRSPLLSRPLCRGALLCGSLGSGPLLCGALSGGTFLRGSLCRSTFLCGAFSGGTFLRRPLLCTSIYRRPILVRRSRRERRRLLEPARLLVLLPLAPRRGVPVRRRAGRLLLIPTGRVVALRLERRLRHVGLLRHRPALVRPRGIRQRRRRVEPIQRGRALTPPAVAGTSGVAVVRAVLILGCPVLRSGPVRRRQLIVGVAVGTGRHEVVNHGLIVPPLRRVSATG
jgi:hypothetical protein